MENDWWPPSHKDFHRVTEAATQICLEFSARNFGEDDEPMFGLFQMGWFNHQPPRHSPRNITFMKAENGAVEEEIPSFQHRVIFRFAKHWGCRWFVWNSWSWMASTSLTCGYLSFFNKNHFPSCIQQFDSKNPRTPRYNPKRNATNMEISIFHEPKLPIEVERNAHFFPEKITHRFWSGSGVPLVSVVCSLQSVCHWSRLEVWIICGKAHRRFVWSLVVFQWGGNHWPSREK